MSCGSDIYSNDCVCSTLLAIAEAQDKIEDDCHTGCRRSIEELKGRIKPKGYDTIPILLTICGTPFSAVGAARHSSPGRHFNIFKSFLFRVQEVSKDTCCATLELLDPVGFPHDDSPQFGPDQNDGCISTPTPGNPDFDNDFFSDFDFFLAKLEDSKKIVRTGICVTVDLKDFTSVSCLPPVITC